LICGSNGTNGEPGWPDAELAKNRDGGGDLSQPGLLRCRGRGPREAAEDEGLPVLLGDWSVRTKGSTGACGGVAHRGRGGEGERGGSDLAHGEVQEKGEGVRRLGAVWRRRAWGGGGLVASGGGGRSASAT
jgi:hypothetical protein